VHELNVAEGLHRIEDAHVNWYLLEESGRLLVIDTGLPASWRSLQRAAACIGRTLADIEAVVLTHGHFDHMGFAHRAQDELGVDVWAPQGEDPVAHPWRYSHEDSRIPYLRHRYFAATFTRMTLAGALGVKGVKNVRSYGPGVQLDVPGRPTTIATPGHSVAHHSLLLPDRGVLLAGDAFVTIDPYTGCAGPRIVAGAATADAGLALASVESLGELDAETALTGHGAPWRGTLREAAARVQEAGAWRR
jgi:glyoxylase-like metal-dependent hydrolase (beta-lactamase superfamily II)